MNTIRSIACLLVLAFVAGCGAASSGSGNSGTNGEPMIQGAWEITATSTSSPGRESYVEADFTPSGANFAASGESLITLSLQGGTASIDPCSTEPTFLGSVSGAAFSGTLTEGTQSVRFAGTVSVDGKSATGTYQSDMGGCTNGDAGTFSASAISEVTGSYSGTLMDSVGNNASATIHFTDSSNFSWTGTGSVTDQAVVQNLSFNGSQIGAFFQGTGTSSNINGSTQIVVAGRVNPSATEVGAFAIADTTGGTVFYTGTLAKSSSTTATPMFQFSVPLPQIHSRNAAP